MSEHSGRFDAPIEMRFIDLFMIIIASLLFIIMTLGVTARRTEVPLKIATDSLPAALLNEHYSLALAKSGGRPPFTWRTVDGALPAGLELRNGHIEGRPRAVGESHFTIELTDGGFGKHRVTLSLDVWAINESSESRSWVTIQKLILPDSSVEQPLSMKLQAAGGSPPYRWELEEGPLPRGLNLAPEGTLTGIQPDYLLFLTGHTALKRQIELREKATHEFTVAAIDSVGARVSQRVQLYIEPLPAPFLMQFLMNDFNQPVNRLIWLLSFITWLLLMILLGLIIVAVVIVVFYLIRIGVTPIYLFLAGYRRQLVTGWGGVFHRQSSQPFGADLRLSPLLIPYAITLDRVIDFIERLRWLLEERKRRKAWERSEALNRPESKPNPGSRGGLVGAQEKTISPRGPFETIKAIFKFLLSFLVLFRRDERSSGEEGEEEEGRREEAEGGDGEEEPEFPEGPGGVSGSPGGGPTAGEQENPRVSNKLTKEMEEYMEALKKGARVRYGGAYLALSFLQAIEFESTMNEVFGPIAKVGNGLLHTSLDKFFQELLGLRGTGNSFSKIDNRFDVILGRKAPEPKSAFGTREPRKKNPMQVELILPTELDSNNQAAQELLMTMRNSARQALDWMLHSLPEHGGPMPRTPKTLRRLLRKQAYIQLKDGVLHVRISTLRRNSARRFAEALCEALNAEPPHTLGRFKFPLKFSVSSSHPG